jgi:SAM-dependent methyltransferase
MFDAGSATDTGWVTPDWLALREQADAEARAPELLGPLRAYLTNGRRIGKRLVIRDLGCGTGSMARWLSGRLAGEQRWVLYDRDPALLDIAVGSAIGPAADGSPVMVVPKPADITRIGTSELTNTSLVTASALLDLLTFDEVDDLAAACVEARCPALFVLSVVGKVDITPVDPLDTAIAAAFNAHQRRVADGRRLLGPDAVDATAVAFGRRGATVLDCPSPWRLGPRDATLAADWLHGWVSAACEQDRRLVGQARAYLRRRLTECANGQLRIVVHHSDLLAFPPPLTCAEAR